MADPAVSCAHSIAIGQVCSHAVTTAELLAWGIEVGIILDHLRVPGPPFHVARHEAWKRGLVRCCTLDPRLTRPHVKNTH